MPPHPKYIKAFVKALGRCDQLVAGIDQSALEQAVYEEKIFDAMASLATDLIDIVVAAADDSKAGETAAVGDVVCGATSHRRAVMP